MANPSAASCSPEASSAVPFPPVPARAGIARDEFAARHLRGNRPLVLSGGVAHWPALKAWTWERFRREFGALRIALSGETFHPKEGMTLSDYLDLMRRFEGMDRGEWLRHAPAPYFRYSWPDHDGTAAFEPLAFRALADEWSRPDFLPAGGYLFPFRPGRLRHRLEDYPEWAVFLSPKGALTRMHVDSHDSNAVLAQIRGRKRGFLFPPGQGIRRRPGSGLPPKARETADLVFEGRDPAFPGLRGYAFDLAPGDILFIPKRWAHEVYTTEASLSLTFNFLHFGEVDTEHIRYRLSRVGKSPYAE